MYKHYVILSLWSNSNISLLRKNWSCCSHPSNNSLCQECNLCPFISRFCNNLYRWRVFPCMNPHVKLQTICWKPLPQYVQLKGLSPAQIRICCFRVLLLLKLLPQTVQLKGFPLYESSFAASDYLIHSFNDSEKFLTVNTHRGLHVYHRLSHGVSSALSIFQGVMDQILQGLDLIEFNRVEH